MLLFILSTKFKSLYDSSIYQSSYLRFTEENEFTLISKYPLERVS